MKYILRCITIFILLLIFPICTYANSGPVYWKEDLFELIDLYEIKNKIYPPINE